MKFQPKIYQDAIRRFVIKTKRCALHVDMGLGKTAAVLTATKQLLDNFAIRGALVIAPLRVATDTWPDEIKQWDHLNNIDYAIVRGTPKERLRILSEDHEIYVVSYGILQWMSEWIIACREDLPFDLLILDESTKLKAGSSKRFKHFKNIPTTLFKRTIEMTGTPMPEKYENLWSQFFLLDRGQRLTPFVTHFRSRWMQENPYNRFQRRMKRGAAQEIEEAISDITLTIRSEDWLDLKTPHINDIGIDFPADLRRAYIEIENEMVTEINNKEFVANNSAIIGEKCRQMCAGVLYRTDEKTKQRSEEQIHTLKLDKLEEIVETTDETLLVAYWYQWEPREFRKRWPHAPILGGGISANELSKAKEAWNKGDIPLMFMHPQSVGHGMNFQYGGHNLLFTNLPWSGEAYDQTIHRLHRTGQTKPVIVHRLMIRDSADERVAKSLHCKDFTQASLMKALATRSKKHIYKS